MASFRTPSRLPLRDHLLATAAFGGLTALWFRPVIADINTRIVGSATGDHITFLWNLWWMRYVLSHDGLSFFQTPFLLHPFGANLTLHTHTALPVFIAALAGPRSLLASQNLIVLGHVFLNFLCAYLLAFQLTRRSISAALAAVVFAWSPFVSARLAGHFNLLGAWVVPLACWAILAARAGNGWWRGAIAGGAIAVAAYVDYYLFVYIGGFALIAFGSSYVALSVRPRGRLSVRRRIAVALAIVAVIELNVMVALRALGIDVLHVGGAPITIRELHNPATAAWLLLAAAAAVRWCPPMVLRLRERGERVGAGVAVAAAITCLGLISPVLMGAIALWRAGSYTTTSYLPRSGPDGVDAVTFLLGNPYSAFWGHRVLAWYRSLGIQPIEACAWLPLSALVLAVVALRDWRASSTVRFWALTGGVFGVWSLGPWLVAAGHRSPLLLPQFAARYVPIVSNARIPGRAIIVVYLALALIAAVGFERLASRGGRRRVLAWALAMACVIELAPATPEMYTPVVPPLYGVLQGVAGAGAVCELPLGMRDGFGEVGRFDAQVLLNQTFHERPIVGGFVARLPPRIVSDYGRLPVLGTLLRLSGGVAIDDRERTVDRKEAARQLAAEGVRFVVLNRDTASPELSAFVEERIALREIARDEHRTVYEVHSTAAAWNRTSGIPAR